MEEQLKQTIIAIVQAYYSDKKKLSRLLDEQAIATNSESLKERAKALLKETSDKEQAVKLLQEKL